MNNLVVNAGKEPTPTQSIRTRIFAKLNQTHATFSSIARVLERLVIAIDNSETIRIEKQAWLARIKYAQAWWIIKTLDPTSYTSYSQVLAAVLAKLAEHHIHHNMTQFDLDNLTSKKAFDAVFLKYFWNSICLMRIGLIANRQRAYQGEL